MKKLISMALALMLIFSASVVANAAPSESDISYKVTIGNDADGYASQTITIKGAGGADAAGKPVSLRVWKLGKSSADYDEASSARADDINLCAVILQTRADAKGNFTFEFLFGEPVGTYSADIKVQGEAIVTKKIASADIDKVNEFIDDINDTNKLDDMDRADFQDILNNPGDFGVDLTVYNKLTPANQNAVLDDVVEKLQKNNKSGNMNSVETFVLYFSESTLVAVFGQTDDEEILGEAFDVYENILNIDELEGADGIYPLYEGFGSSRTEALSAMGNTDYKDLDDIIEAFKESVFLKAVKDAKYYTELEPIIEDNLDYLALDSDAEKEYNDDESVKIYVLKKLNNGKSSISTIGDFRDAFEDAVDDYGSGDKKGGSGGSGGGSSSSITVDSSLTPTVTPIQTVAVYNDISGHWAQEAITYLSNARILAGRGDGTFDPDAAVTRAEYVKMIVEAYGLYNANATASFGDLDMSNWSYRYVASMVDLGYILGDSNGNFNPTALISRQDMAVILHRVLQGQNLLPVIESIEQLFDDFDEVSPYAQNSIAYMSNMKLINGSDGKVRPLASSTRAEAAQIIYNAITEVNGK